MNPFESNFLLQYIFHKIGIQLIMSILSQVIAHSQIVMQVPCILGINLTDKDLLEYIEQVLLILFLELRIIPNWIYHTFLRRLFHVYSCYSC